LRLRASAGPALLLYAIDSSTSTAMPRSRVLPSEGVNTLFVLVRSADIWARVNTLSMWPRTLLCGLLSGLAGSTCLMPMLQAQSNRVPPVRYQVSVAHESGLTVVFFDTSIGSAVLYLPQDLV